MAMLRSENSLNEDLIDIMMEDERAETQPVTGIATPPKPFKIEAHSLSKSPSPSPFGNSPAEMEPPVIFTGHLNGTSNHLLSPIPIGKQHQLHRVSPVKDRHQNALSLAKFVVNHDTGLDYADGQNGKPEGGHKPVLSHISSPDVNKMRDFHNRLFPMYKNTPTLSSPYSNPVTNVLEDGLSGDQPPPGPLELRVYQVCIYCSVCLLLACCCCCCFLDEKTLFTSSSVPKETFRLLGK